MKGADCFISMYSIVLIAFYAKNTCADFGDSKIIPLILYNNEALSHSIEF